MTSLYRFRLHRVLFLVLIVFYLAAVAAPGWAQFETRTVQPLPFGAFSIATGDFNHDGNLDIAVVDDNGFSVSLGKGDGTFRRPTQYAATGFSIAAGDFNNDGDIDLVMANGDASVSVYLGNGDGTFRLPKTTATTENCSFLVIGNFNGDHNLDIAVVDTPYVSVLLGNGDGTFQAPSDNDSFVGAQKLAVGDFNNDHKLDVVVVGFFGGSQDIGVLLGNGDGTLQPSLTYPLTYTPAYVAVGDFNQDGNLDAVIADEFSSVTVLLGNGLGAFGPGVTYSTTSYTGAPVVVGDLNLDGKLDVAIGTGPPGGADVFWGNGDGTFEPAQFFDTRLTGFPTIGDFNGDRLPDLVLANEYSVVTVLNTGVVAFRPTAPLDFGVRLVGTTSPPQVVTLTNNGAAALSIQSIRLSGDFGESNNCGSSVAAGASCDIRSFFRPGSVGRQEGLVTVVDSASSKPQVIKLSGYGTKVDLSPNPMDFGPQKVGTTSPPQHLTITNDSGAALTITNIYLEGSNEKNFAISGIGGCTSRQIAPGGSCRVAVNFTPLQTGRLRATFSVLDDVPGELHSGSLQTAALTGTGD